MRARFAVSALCSTPTLQNARETVYALNRMVRFAALRLSDVLSISGMAENETSFSRPLPARNWLHRKQRHAQDTFLGEQFGGFVLATL
jgi:hypothetical protein